MNVLIEAWHEIRRNAETSRTASTKQVAREFGRHLPRNLGRIQRQLRRGYKFQKAYGATPAKGAGKIGKRPIVVAPLPDRIVQRAILDVLHDASNLVAVQSALETQTSIGGIRGRGVDHAIRLFDERYEAGARFVAGSDIAGFFTKIPRGVVIEAVSRDTDDQDFVDLFERALTVELKNADKMSAEDLKLFPTGLDGVAQGCPLSALAGNIVLQAFDHQMNEAGRGVTCIRYIDDFILMGRTTVQVTKALKSAQALLSELGMKIYDPATTPDKAFAGPIGQPHQFLGYEIVPNEYRPAERARDRLLGQVEALLKEGRASISAAIDGRALKPWDRAYAQTLTAVDNTVRGWRASFRSAVCKKTFNDLDSQIDRRLKDFEGFYHRRTRNCDPKYRRRATGVGLLSDGFLKDDKGQDFRK